MKKQWQYLLVVLDQTHSRIVQHEAAQNQLAVTNFKVKVLFSRLETESAII